ncbi:MAG: hypothetical protein KDA80_06240 [Planctomycetaceae bacterium]|nr:hypothetical protein [Planctomycetaceae bacterium]
MIGTMLLSVITLDTIAVLYKLGESGIPIACGMMALLIPAIQLRKIISLT